MTRSVEATNVRSVPRLVRRPTETSAVPRRIMVSTELLWADGTAISVAASLAAATAAELVVVGIAPVLLPEPEPTLFLDGPWTRSHRDEQELLDQVMREHLSDVAARLPAGVRVRTVLDWGTRAGGLLHACHNEHPDLVVVARVEGGPVRRLLHNHTSRAVLGRIEAPVLVVPVAR
jgi:nucleotide-binding universal stress UspA family protein